MKTYQSNATTTGNEFLLFLNYKDCILISDNAENGINGTRNNSEVRRDTLQTGSEAHPASCTMDTGSLFPGGKARPGRNADHSPPSSAEVKNE
jgi:hypothetical protein